MTSVDHRNDDRQQLAAVPGDVRRWRAFSLLAMAFLMTVVDLAIVNVALPTIGRQLHFPETDLQWVVTAYALTFGGFLLLGGRAADLLGRRRLFMAGLALFTAASLACALATTDTFLIIMRGIQGLGAALVVPAALSIVMNMFAEGAERNKALGIWGGIGAAGATIGVLAGGLLTRYAGWQYIFYLNVPIGAAALLLARRVVPESRLAGARRSYDMLGAVTVTGALVMLVYAISQAPPWAGHRSGRWLCWLGRRRCWPASWLSRPGPRRRCCRCGYSGCGHWPGRTRSASCSGPASSRSSSSGPCTCSRCSGIPP
jgi:MFS family permease